MTKQQDEYWKTWFERATRARGESGKSQEWVARKAKCSRDVISDFENMKRSRISQKNRTAIEKALQPWWK